MRVYDMFCNYHKRDLVVIDGEYNSFIITNKTDFKSPVELDSNYLKEFNSFYIARGNFLYILYSFIKFYLKYKRSNKWKYLKVYL